MVKPMQLLNMSERQAWTLGGLVSLMTLLCTVWYAAISLNNMQHSMSELNEEMLKVVYVNHDHLMIRARDGRDIKLPFMARTEGLLTKSDGEDIQFQLYTLKEHLVMQGVCEDVRTCG
ncbi:TMhelix containing protein [Vibrio phage 409E50-1]|nr:TMhelix containing protein [Vibrio phage 521E56-1]CAH9011878.1 TMhelix containing protein [Vibrio phage 384E50-1]CAH9011907.1 TMhelix containing protein [Vibrio phage 409E50-1]CAH9011914.1 TMhelix containing protein [Vibrio phage 402E50-1]CAH9013238.1 TMhelix containing protein [Vibrio phage 405E50-1]CAH9013299.1 TMhelix containing protein [Vibrio phage 413E50-1]